jgi:hypothetical protein
MQYPRRGKLNGRKLELARREWRKQNKLMIENTHRRYGLPV